VPKTNKALKPSEQKYIKAVNGGDMMWVSWCQVENMISTAMPQTNKALKPSEHKSLRAGAGRDMT
jgi:hypothetical protein